MEPSRKIFLKSCRYNVRNYALNFSIMKVFSHMIWSGLSAVVSSIEKRYSLSSAQSGFIFSSSEIGRIPCVFLVSHFGNRFSTPRIVAISGMFISVSTFIMASPHFIFQPGILTSTSPVLSNEFCMISNRSLIVNSTKNDITTVATNNNLKAYAVICTGMFLMGVSMSPMPTLSLSYIDNNAVEGSSPVYLGFIAASRAIAPIISSFLASYYLSLYVDLSETSLTPEDPGWVGAWWLMILSISITVLLTSPWMACYPKDTGTNPLSSKLPASPCGSTLEKKTEKTISSDILKKNSVDFHRETELQEEHVDADKEHYTIKGLGGVPSIFSAITISVVFKKFKLSYLSTIKCIIGAFVVVVLANVGMWFVGCPSPELASTVLNRGKEITPRYCNTQCGCSTKFHVPYCDNETDLTYFSPCYAGCSPGDALQVIGNCTCAPDARLHRGSCRRCESYKFPLFICLFYIDTYFLQLTVTPFQNLCMRAVSVRDKSLALGVVVCMLSLLSWLPASIYYGKVIDLACSVWQMVDGTQGSCWMYNFEKFRMSYFGLNTALDVTALAFLVLALVLAKNKKIKWSSGLEEKIRGHSRISTSIAMAKTDGDNA